MISHHNQRLVVTPWYQRVLDALEKDIAEAESIGVEAYGMIVDFHV